MSDQLLVATEHAEIVEEAFTRAEVEGVAVEIARSCACFLGDEYASGVVPNTFEVACSSGHPNVEIRIAARDECVLRLAVKTQTCDGAGEKRQCFRAFVMRTVRGFDALGNANCGT